MFSLYPQSTNQQFLNVVGLLDDQSQICMVNDIHNISIRTRSVQKEKEIYTLNIMLFYIIRWHDISMHWPKKQKQD